MVVVPADMPPAVLVVEDDPVAAVMLRRHLESQGYSVHQAPNGAAALEMHQRNQYRIVVSDWMMPAMDGVSLCRAFRNLGGSYVYFVLCSARTDRADRTEAFEAGVDDFLSKPIDRGELASRLIVARRILASEDGLKRQRKQLEETARRLAESNVDLRTVSRKYAELFQGLPVPCFTYDRDGLIREWNEKAETTFGIFSGDAVGRAVWDLFSSAQSGVWGQNRARTLLQNGGGASFDWAIDYEDGSTRYFAANIICRLDDSGDPVGVVCSNVDITERKRAEEQVAEYTLQVSAQKAALEAMNAQLNELAITDELTGLANRRWFREAVHAALRDCAERENSVSLLLLDLDHFKRVNDVRGHLGGDAVLREFAAVLRATAGEYDLLARYGGEEFAILLPGTDAREAREAGERYRKAIEAYAWDGLSITTSVGVATVRAGIGTHDLLVGQADAALYAAKAAGRNLVFCADPLTSVAFV